MSHSPDRSPSWAYQVELALPRCYVAAFAGFVRLAGSEPTHAPNPAVHGACIYITDITNALPEAVAGANGEIWPIRGQEECLWHVL